MLDAEREEYHHLLYRATNVAMELASIVRRDATLFKRVKPRTLRWIKKQDEIALAKKDAKDLSTRLAKRKEKALSKLTRSEQELLGVYNGPTDDE